MGLMTRQLVAMAKKRRPQYGGPDITRTPPSLNNILYCYCDDLLPPPSSYCYRRYFPFFPPFPAQLGGKFFLGLCWVSTAKGRRAKE